MFILDPKTLAATLASYPHIQSAVEDPFDHPPAVNFPEARLFKRQIFRVLANLDYEHLQRLVDSIEFCAGRGFPLSKLLLSGEPTDFQSGIAELYVAEHFLKMGASVEPLDATKGNDRVPEFIVSTAKGQLACEVYTPRDWQGLELFENELRLALLHLDIPYDFELFGRMELLDHFKDGKLVWFDPGAFSRENTPEKRQEKITRITTAVSQALKPGEDTELSFPEESLNIRTVLKFQNIRKAVSALPFRPWGYSAATLTGYSPEGMFAKMLMGKLKRKAWKDQAAKVGSVGASRALVVDVGHLAYPEEFSHQYYKGEFDRIARENVKFGGYDAIVFLWTRSTGLAGGKALLQFRKPGSSDEFLDGVFGPS